MSQLNKKNTAARAVSYNGNPQFKKNSAQELFEIAVMTLIGKDSFYEDNDARLVRLAAAVDNVVASGNLDFIANTIVYARDQMRIRSLPIVLTILFAKAIRDQNKSYSNLRAVVRDVIQRADQITDMYAVAIGIFGNKNKVPMAIKRGVADAFNKFDEYQFAKYNRSGAIKLRDVLRIVHPKGASEEQGELFNRIMTDALTVPYTWETELSKNGQLPASERKSDKEIWTELVNSGKLNYMALLRNLRNIIDANVDTTVIDKVAATISDEKQVLRSKQLPFRFINALESIEGRGNQKIKRAVSRALDLSLANIPVLGKNIWIIVDCSGSMTGGYFSRRNENGMTPMKTAAIFAAALSKANADANNVMITLFSDSAKHITLNPDDSVMSNVNTLLGKVYGGGTNLDAALKLKNSLGFNPDTVVVLSDMQVNQLRAGNVASLFDDNAIKVAFNLDAYESTPLSEIQGWYQLSGWSERVFDFIPMWRDRTSIVKALSHPYEPKK